MSGWNSNDTITILLPGKAPRVISLTQYCQAAYRYGYVDEVLLRLGRGDYHGPEGGLRNDIVIEQDCAFVSRAQCTFHFSGGKWYLVDDNSRNGMIYQQKKTNVVELHDGDKVYIGEKAEHRMVILFFSREGEEEAGRVEQYPLKSQGRFLIGRDESCDIVISHPMVSRFHCGIEKEKDTFYIFDTGSKNGVLLNGTPLTRREPLQEMDKISIGDTTLFYSDGSLFFNEPQGGVSLVASSLTKVVGRGKEKKAILQDASFSIQPNEFVAIIGGSGAGKTTLLDCISGMTDYTQGSVLVNGEDIALAGKNFRSIMGYVPQQDIVYDNLTLERMLYYSALLRMPEDMSRKELKEKIEETIRTVELTEQKHTMIRKLSGGQRKRASIAVELLASPKLFFLDEPSSGLDPGTEKHLMQMLRSISMAGTTVIMVTHTVQNLDLCDRVICMGKGGRLCYSGAPKGALSYFGKDSYTDIYDAMNEESEKYAAAWAQGQHREAERAPASSGKKKKRRPLIMPRQFWVMTRRYGEILKNSWPRLLLLLLMPGFLTLLVCLAYQVDGGLYSTLGISIVRNSFVYLSAPDTLSFISAFSCAAFWIGIFNSIQEISKERTIFERERFNGVFPFPYVLSKLFILTVLCFLQSIFMTQMLWSLGQMMESGTSFGMTYVGVYYSGSSFWWELFITTFLCSLSAMCLGLVISASVSNEMAMVICPICLLPQILFSGIASELSGITKTLSNIISCRWSCIAYLTSLGVNDMYVSYEYENITDPQKSVDLYTDCAYAVDTSYLFDKNPVESAWIALGLIALVCFVGAVIALSLRKKRER